MLLSTIATLCHISTSSIGRSQSVYMLANIYYNLEGVKQYCNVGLTFISLMISSVEHLFTCLL